MSRLTPRPTFPMMALLAAVVSIIASCAPMIERAFHPDGTLRLEVPRVEQMRGKFKIYVRDGEYHEWHLNGHLKTSGDYVDGKRSGEWREFYDNDKLHRKGLYLHGKKSGIWLEYYMSGQVSKRFAYHEGIRSGPIAAFWPSGRKRLVGQRNAKGKRYLRWTWWHENGQIERIGSFLNGRRHGEWRSFYDSGQPRARGEYRHGQRIGRWLTFFRNGTKKAEGVFTEKGSVWTEWSSVGPAKRTVWRNDEGTVVRASEWGYGPKELNDGTKVAHDKIFTCPRGTRLAGANYNAGGTEQWCVSKSSGERHGPFVSWNRKGQKITQGEYKGGQKHGVWRSWWENGTPWIVTLWKDGVKEGKQQFFHPNGQLQMEGSWQNGQRHGLWRYYTSKGRLERKTTFENGRKVTQ
ncbi:MAG: toxin-antitoxin system YwqK family antitoxin [Myxococcales bacterium]|nr:toxin-antitoxin system YwqK family antitoxin [Myxococcales bacterium]